MTATVKISSEPLPDMGVALDWMNDNSLVIEKGPWGVQSITFSADDQNALYAFLKAQRTAAGLPV